MEFLASLKATVINPQRPVRVNEVFLIEDRNVMVLSRLAHGSLLRAHPSRNHHIWNHHIWRLNNGFGWVTPKTPSDSHAWTNNLAGLGRAVRIPASHAQSFCRQQR